MSNATLMHRKRLKTPCTDTVTEWVWRGYEDARNGLSYRADYEDAPLHQQRNYERGRLMAAALRGDGATLPKWARNRRLGTTVGPLVGSITRNEAAYLNRDTVGAAR